METDKTKISGARFMFTVALFLQSSVLLTSFVSSITLHDTWWVIIFASILCIPMIFMFKTIMMKFPQNDLIEILRIVFGKVVGNGIAIFYILFFLLLTALNLNDLGEFAKLTVMFNTPKVVLILFGIFVATFAVRFGLGVVTRYTAIFTFLEFTIVIASILFILSDIDFTAFMPMFNLELIKYVQSTHVVLTIPIGETVIFLMLTPNINIEKKKFTKYWFGGIAMGIGTMFFVVLRDIGVLENTLHLFKLPGLITLRLINLGPTLSRMEILFAAALMFLLFFKVSLLLYVTTKSISTLFKTKGHKNLTLIIGVLTTCIAMTLYNEPIIHAESAKNYTVVVWTVLEIIIPVLLLILAFLRKLPKKEEKAEVIQKNNHTNSHDNFKKRKSKAVQKSKQEMKT